jgi:hypothetical protein
MNYTENQYHEGNKKNSDEVKDYSKIKSKKIREIVR